MRYRRRLRSRIILSFLLFGTLLSGLFALSTLVLQDYLENQLVAETLKKEVDDYIQTLRLNPGVREPFHTRIEGYVTAPGKAEIVPTIFRDLPAGVHKVSNDSGTWRAAIRKDKDLWVFLTQDISNSVRMDQRLNWALIGVVGIFSLLSLLLGRWSSGRIMKPVADLARRLSKFDETTKPEALAQYFADDEVGQLASALDDYADHLHHLVERDREFNADVSHELRTPLTVISGATELLLNQKDLPEKIRTRLLRIARAARQSADTTNALLHLVRAEKGVNQDSRSQDVYTIVKDLITHYQPLIGNKPVHLSARQLNKVSVIAPESVIAVTIGNLIGNAVRYTHTGTIDVIVGDGIVEVLDSGPGVPEEEVSSLFQRHYRGNQVVGKGSGLGLAIVKRLCNLYHWKIEISNRPSGGLRAAIAYYADE
ncbi:MAG: HAMP domain-containing histidine kinase [Xanthomonadales bacterium]|nr:HAMP domain-containing histidine kinase [Xanthomonadales bacterium]